MTIRFPALVAASFALSQLSVAPAQAQSPAAQFRTAEPQTFNAADLAVLAYQEQGYSVQLVLPEEAAA